MLFRQIKYRGDNFSYVIADEVTKEAVVVDPSYNEDVLALFIRDQKLKLDYIIDTHGHGDHTAGNDGLKSAFHAKVVAYESSRVRKDLSVVEGDVLELGKIAIKVLYTPGHTSDSMCLLVDGKVLTGDTLFVGECGRTDLQGGSPEDMYRSLARLKGLDDGVEVYPGHDYGLRPYSTIGEEKRTNYTLEDRSLKDFLEFMSIP
jgi:hydroxyacylglutathione hydrolase